MIAWDEQSIAWYSSASAYTGYHADLADLLIRRNSSCTSALDLGAGAGDLSLALARRGVRVLAAEVQPAAVSHLQRVAAAGKLPMTVYAGDWTGIPDALAGDAKQWQANTAGQAPFPLPADMVILSYCGGVSEHWNELRRLCRRTLVVLTGMRRVQPPFGLKGFASRERRKRDTPESVRDSLRGYGVSFTEEPYCREFGQVLRDASDLREFLWRYYGSDVAARASEAEAQCRVLDDGRLYLPYMREAVLFIVAMGEE